MTLRTLIESTIIAGSLFLSTATATITHYLTEDPQKSIAYFSSAMLVAGVLGCKYMAKYHPDPLNRDPPPKYN